MPKLANTVPTLSTLLLFWLLFWAVMAVGCGATQSAATQLGQGRVEPAQDAAQLVQLGQRNEHLESRLRELEGRLSLSRAEAREFREEAALRDASPDREVVRIGGAGAVVAAGNEQTWDEPLEEAFVSEDNDSARPLLRLYGSPAAAPLDTSTPLVIPPPPQGIPVGLPIAALPEPERAFAVRAQRSPHLARARRADEAALAGYQQALAHLSDRRFDDALSAFDSFLRAHPRHPYASSAVYWQGEVYYAMRDYRHALSRFSQVVDDYPRATKVADSLFKMAMCHKRMGRERAARRVFQRVRREFPESVAARLSVQEGA